MMGVGIPLAMRGLSLPQISWPLAPFALAFPIVFFRWSKSLWLGIDLYITRLIPK